MMSTMATESSFPITPGRQSSFDKYAFPFEETFPDDVNPFRAENTGAFTQDPYDQRAASPTGISVSTPPKSSLYDIPLTPTDSPTTVVYGPGSRCAIRIEKKSSSNTVPIPSVESTSSKGTITGVDQSRLGESSSEVNPATRLNIDDLDDFHFQRMLHQVKDNKRIYKLVISRRAGSRRVRPAWDLTLLYQAIQTLPRLQSLYLDNFEAGDLEGVHEALYAHPTLMAFRLSLTRGSVDDITLRTLCSIPYLADVTIEGNESFSFDVLLRSTSIRTIHVSSSGPYFSFSNAHMTPLVKMIETNSTLQHLYLEIPMSFIVFKLLAYALRTNSSIQTLQVSLSGKGQEADRIVNEIVSLLETNRTLKTLWNIQYESMKVCPSSQDRLMAALEKNNTIKSFLFIDEDLSFQKRKDELFQKRKISFFAYLSGCGKIMPEMDSRSLMEQVRTQGIHFSKGLKQAKTKGSEVGCNLASSFEIMINKTKSIDFSLCCNPNVVDDKTEQKQTIR